MQDVSIIIKTFERPRSLRRLLKSIAAHQPSCPVIVSDDSNRPSRNKMLAAFPSLALEYYEMPFDSGVCAGRNLTLSHVRTPYFVHCDDDFVFDSRADLASARDMLEQHGLDILAGLYYDVAPMTPAQWLKAIGRLELFRIKNRITMEGVPRRFFGDFAPNPDGTVRLVEIPYQDPLVRCDLGQNFFIARTERVRDTLGGWNEAIKIGGDHEDFFYRAKQAGLAVAQTERFGTIHYREMNSVYAAFRRRAKTYRPKMFDGWF